VALTALVAAGLVARFVLLRDTETTVTTDEALAEFRAASPVTEAPSIDAAAPSTADAPAAKPPTTAVSPPGSPSGVPPPTTAPRVPATLVEPGVYRYRTTGGEQIDAVGGTSHDYPAETTITVTARGCGVWLRWDALRERREEWGLCVTPAGIELRPDGVQFHEFFGQSEEEALVCDRAVVLLPAELPQPEPVPLECTLADDPWSPVWEILEADTRTVEGEDVTVRHARMTITDEDEFWERNTADWYLAPDGLPVEVVVAKSSRSPSAIGPVVYEEQYRLDLVTLEPLR
jgi:hypothetical protein